MCHKLTTLSTSRLAVQRQLSQLEASKAAVWANIPLASRASRTIGSAESPSEYSTGQDATASRERDPVIGLAPLPVPSGGRVARPHAPQFLAEVGLVADRPDPLAGRGVRPYEGEAGTAPSLPVRPSRGRRPEQPVLALAVPCSSQRPTRSVSTLGSEYPAGAGGLNHPACPSQRLTPTSTTP